MSKEKIKRAKKGQRTPFDNSSTEHLVCRPYTKGIVNSGCPGADYIQSIVSIKRLLNKDIPNPKSRKNAGGRNILKKK